MLTAKRLPQLCNIYLNSLGSIVLHICRSCRISFSPYLQTVPLKLVQGPRRTAVDTSLVAVLVSWRSSDSLVLSVSLRDISYSRFTGSQGCSRAAVPGCLPRSYCRTKGLRLRTPRALRCPCPPCPLSASPAGRCKDAVLRSARCPRCCRTSPSSAFPPLKNKEKLKVTIYRV